MRKLRKQVFYQLRAAFEKRVRTREKMLEISLK